MAISVPVKIVPESLKNSGSIFFSKLQNLTFAP